MNKHQKALTMTVPEAALALGIGRNLAYEAVKDGQIPSVRIGNRILVPAAGLDRLLSEKSPRVPNR
jgi:excisionase family DNA binding protein